MIRHFSNFSEYQETGKPQRFSQIRFQRTSVSYNIPRLRPNFEIGSLVWRNL